MNLAETLKLMEQYAVCPKCGNRYIGNGEGKLITEGNSFYRSCKCGWEVNLPGGGRPMTQSNKKVISAWRDVIQSYKLIYCNNCEVEEIIDKHKPDKCPFCESENVVVGGKP